MPTRTLLPDAVLPDAVLRAADAISVPRRTAANSFVLHAPLELMARVGLLPWLDAEPTGDAIEAIERLGREYGTSGEPVDTPTTAGAPDAAALVNSMAAGDLDLVDRLAAAVLPTMSAHEAVGLLGPTVVPSLAAAGHAPIGLHLLTRVGDLPTTLLRGTLRSLAAHPEWRIGWFDSISGDGDPSGLYDALKVVPMMGRPGSDFIHPLMSQVQDTGVAARLLSPLLSDRIDVPEASRTLARAAAWSMVHDDPSQAPYGWTHALTMPQGVMALAGAGVPARTAFAVAATFMVGFRAAHGTVELPALLSPGPAPDVTSGELAAAASRHHDAHVVKYTLACLHAADDDPGFRPLYLSAAAYLLEWWQTQHS
jgi:hypothetical protein